MAMTLAVTIIATATPAASMTRVKPPQTVNDYSGRVLLVVAMLFYVAHLTGAMLLLKRQSWYEGQGDRARQVSAVPCRACCATRADTATILCMLSWSAQAGVREMAGTKKARSCCARLAEAVA